MPSFAEYKLPLFAPASTHRLVVADTFGGCACVSAPQCRCFAQRRALSVFCSVRYFQLGGEEKARRITSLSQCVRARMCTYIVTSHTREHGIERAEQTATHQSWSSGSKQRLVQGASSVLFDSSGILSVYRTPITTPSPLSRARQRPLELGGPCCRYAMSSLFALTLYTDTAALSRCNLL